MMIHLCASLVQPICQVLASLTFYNECDDLTHHCPVMPLHKPENAQTTILRVLAAAAAAISSSLSSSSTGSAQHQQTTQQVR